MSNFLLSHPISHLVLMQIRSAVCTLIVVFCFVTLLGIQGVPRDLWSSTKRSRRTWITLAAAASLLSAVGVITIFFSEYLGAAMVATAGLVPVAWWGWPRRDLRAQAAARGLPDPMVSGRRNILFDGSPSWASRVFRILLAVFAAVGLSIVWNSFDQWTIGDPDTVFITDLNHDIQPKPYIAAACPDITASTLHFSWNDPAFKGHSYQRWTVVPKPGHLDEVFLDTDTGKVICP
jgi:hypothetical protein